MLFRVAPSPPEHSEAANAEEESAKINKRLALVLGVTMSVSCSRLGKPSDEAITRTSKQKCLGAGVESGDRGRGQQSRRGNADRPSADDAAGWPLTDCVGNQGVSRVNDQMSIARRR